MAITNYKGLMVPTLADATAITTSTTTQELDPAGALVVNLTNSGGSDLASLPDPQPYHSKILDSNNRNRTPKVIPGQLVKLVLVADSGGTVAVSYKNVLGTAKTATKPKTAITTITSKREKPFLCLVSNSIMINHP